MSWRPMFIFKDGNSFGNAQRFATREEALASARDRFFAWTVPIDYSIEESIDDVNYKRVDDRDVFITPRYVCSKCGNNVSKPFPGTPGWTCDVVLQDGKQCGGLPTRTE